jgi:hypothetical protein
MRDSNYPQNLAEIANLDHVAVQNPVQVDADLAGIIAAWPTLPAATRRAMLALID